MQPNTNNSNTGSVNYNQVVTPVAPNSVSSAANIVGYGAGGNAIYANQPITTQDLQPTQPLKLPTATVPTVPSSLGGAIQASVNTNKTELQRYLDEQQQLKDTTGKDLKTMMGEIMGTTNEIANAPSSVDRTAQNKAREEIDLYTNQIEQEQLANRRLIENLQKNNPQGTFGGALTDKIQNLERDSLSKQADLAILQNAATRNFTTAKDIADQQVQLKLEPLKAKLDNLKFFYSENKEQFNKADDRLFQNKIKEEERVYQREEKNLQQIADIKFNAVKNGAPLSVINRLAKAKTVDEALAFAGNYNTDPLDRALKQAQLSKVYSDINSNKENTNGTVGIDLSSGVGKESLKADPVGVISEVIKSSKIKKGSTSLESLLGVLGAAKNLADYGTAQGGYKGAAPVRVQRGFTKNTEQITTQGQIEAINLKVQQWASGAALTTEQTKQVKRFTPDKNDTDKQIKAKINNLSNFMLGQAKSSLANEGVNIQIPQIDLFDVTVPNASQYVDTIENALNNTNSYYNTYGL